MTWSFLLNTIKCMLRHFTSAVISSIKASGISFQLTLDLGRVQQAAQMSSSIVMASLVKIIGQLFVEAMAGCYSRQGRTDRSADLKLGRGIDYNKSGLRFISYNKPGITFYNNTQPLQSNWQWCLIQQFGQKIKIKLNKICGCRRGWWTALSASPLVFQQFAGIEADCRDPLTIYLPAIWGVQ